MSDSEQSIQGAQDQLEALAGAERAAFVEAHPVAVWWFPLAAGLLGPIAVLGEVLSGTTRVVVVLALVAAFGGLTFVASAHERSARVRRERYALRGRFAVVQVFSLLILIGTLQLVEPLTEYVHSALLVVLSYGFYTCLAAVWVGYTNRLIARCGGAEEPA